jgi:hypothetical protein
MLQTVHGATRLNHYENVVIEYLRADRAIFLNTQYCIQLTEHHNPDKSGPHWYCDALALDFRSKTIFLCEVSYAVGLWDLINRLRDWHEHWDEVRKAVERDSCLAGLALKDWSIKPWVFIRKEEKKNLDDKLKLFGGGQRFECKITSLDEIQPWLYPSWNRKPE